MTAPPVTAVVAVPPGRVAAADALTDALAHVHPGWAVRCVWAGDPTLRPAASFVWTDAPIAELDLVCARPDARPWLAAVAAMRTDDVDLSTPVVFLVAGAVALDGSIDDLVADTGRWTFVPRRLGLEAVGATPTHPDLEAMSLAGDRWDCIASFGGGGGNVDGDGHDADRALGIVASALSGSLRGEDVPVGRMFDAVDAAGRADLCRAPAIGVSAWRWPDDSSTSPRLLIAPGHDAARPWLLDPELAGPPRVSLADRGRRELVERLAEQFAGSSESLRLPGGVPIDETIRRTVCLGISAEGREAVPDAPWTRPAEFRRWLDEHYWGQLWNDRPDVAAAFPHPTGIDADRFATWAATAAVTGDAPFGIDPAGVRRGLGPVVARGHRRDGVNLVGYFRHQSGVAHIARRVADILGRHGVPFSTVAWERTLSPPIDPPPAVDQALDFEASVCFVNGDQYAALRRDLPEVVAPGRRAVAVSFWELDTLAGGPPVDPTGIDQIWAATSFMTAPFSELSVPVHHVHVPFAAPAPSARTRAEFGPLAEADGRFVFGVVLDHLSITARKNPLGAIEAFRRAFEPGGAPLLLVKTINGHRAWADHEQLRVAAAGRDDIVIWDEVLPFADHLALIRSFDALVSLHRSEGLGLHLAEAMSMERPVIATRYSGNLDFMDDESAVLVDADLVPVSDGGWAYPASARWADPDLDQAADAMRRLAQDPAAARDLGRRAAAKIASMPDEPAFVERLVDLLDLDR